LRLDTARQRPYAFLAVTPLSRNFLIRLSALFLALAAVAFLLGLATHGHEGRCHDDCWLCHSSLYSATLPSTITVVAMFLATVIYHEFSEHPISDLWSSTSSPPRAPPS
jgi:hypothetical protein